MMSLAPTSPRLPSPPPPAEIQIGPKSPSMGPAAARQAQQMEQTAMDANSKRRIHPGTRAADMAAGPPLIPLQELDSAFQLQEHLAALHYYHTASNTSPVTRETAKMLAAPPPGTDKTLWLYELCRFLIGQCNSLIVGFLFDTPPCSANTCPEMRASEWQFLCAVHDAPKSCCAIDYSCHTLDWAANVVTNAKIFPSRFVVDSHDKTTALKNLVNVFRRLHRIFAHAWFQHRGVFWSIEGQTGLYVFFKTVCDVYDLLPGENYKLPPEAEGLESITSAPENGGSDAKQHAPAPVLLTKTSSQRMDLDEQGDFSAGRTNTKRHIKSSPSTGSAVGTVLEADEDDTSDVASRMKQMHISEDGQSDEAMNVPVIVEHTMVEQPPLRPPTVIPISGASTKVSEPSPDEDESPVPTPQVESVAPAHQSSDNKKPTETQNPEKEAESNRVTEPASEESPLAEPTVPGQATREEASEKAAKEQDDSADAIPKDAAAGKDDGGPLPDEITVEIKSLSEPEPEESPSSSLGAEGDASEEDTSKARPTEALEEEKEAKKADGAETELPSSASRSAEEPDAKTSE